MRIAKLYGRHQDKTIYILGTGPSVRYFPIDFLGDKITIGLNQAWRYCPLTYSITVHPELVLDYLKEEKPYATQWIIKKKEPMENLSLDDKRFFVFLTKDDLQIVGQRVPDILHLSKGIHCTAMDLAARMGADTIVLVGVDMGSIGGEHHAHDQHVQFHGLPPPTVYEEYRHYAAKVRSVLRGQGVSVISMSPFLGIDAAEEDRARLSQELNLPTLPEPKDVSTYTREVPTLK